jgi:hypothetical protein
MHDLKNAIRLARRNPVFTGVAVMTLAIGIGALRIGLGRLG